MWHPHLLQKKLLLKRSNFLHAYLYFSPLFVHDVGMFLDFQLLCQTFPEDPDHKSFNLKVFVIRPFSSMKNVEFSIRPCCQNTLELLTKKFISLVYLKTKSIFLSQIGRGAFVRNVTVKSRFSPECQTFSPLMILLIFPVFQIIMHK